MGLAVIVVQACGEQRGKEAGYLRHRRALQPPCQSCLQAHNEDSRKYRLRSELDKTSRLPRGLIVRMYLESRAPIQEEIEEVLGLEAIDDLVALHDGLMS